MCDLPEQERSLKRIKVDLENENIVFFVKVGEKRVDQLYWHENLGLTKMDCFFLIVILFKILYAVFLNFSEIVTVYQSRQGISSKYEHHKWAIQFQLRKNTEQNIWSLLRRLFKWVHTFIRNLLTYFASSETCTWSSFYSGLTNFGNKTVKA